MAHLSRGQDIDYMNQMPTMQEMRRLNAEGKLQGPQKQYFEPAKPVEELYDVVADPHEVNNLAGDPKFKDVLERMRRVHHEWQRDTMDIGLVPEPIFDEVKRPGGKVEKTAEPVFIRQTGNAKEGGTVTIACPTQGSSIAWRIGGDARSDTGWELYAKPVPVKPQEVLCAKACRIGFRNSDVVTFKLGDPIKDKPKATETRHWREDIEASGLRSQLAKIKEFDYQGPNATPTYLASLKDPRPAVRYWAVVGLRAAAKYPADLSLAKLALAAMLQDQSVVVRIAAAHALCDWGDEKTALPVLVEALKNPTDKTRLFAVIALDKIGEKARPALAQIQALTKDRDEYVKRVATTASERLQAKGGKKA